ncbi:MAG: phosphatidylserine decarboxylase [Planctomycetota bacterium]
MLSKHAKLECITIAAVGFMLSVVVTLLGLWFLLILTVPATFALLLFFRDPERRTPTQRGVMVAPCDGRISSIHELDHYEPLGGPAICVRIFMSVLDVHINYSPYHTSVESITHTPGEHLNTLKPESAEDNESNLLVLVHPNRRYKMAAVRQVAGMLARTIVCHVHEDQVIQRGQRIGLIKLGSTTELYILKDLSPRLQVKQGQRVTGSVTVVAQITPKEGAAIIARPEEAEQAEEDDAAEHEA